MKIGRQFSLAVPHEEEMRLLGGRLSDCVPDRAIIFLDGELGAGKTTLVRAFIQALESSQMVKSPSFTLVESYVIHGRWFYHFDLYRMNYPEELDFIGAHDYFGTGICFVEWAEKGLSHLPPPDLVIFIEVENKERHVKLTARSSVGEEIITRIKAHE